MVDIEFKNLIEKVKDQYKKLEPVACPVFNNELVHFNHYGFDHLIMKQRKFRTSEEIKRRFRLMRDVTYILENTSEIFSEEKRVKGNSIAYFWTIKRRIGNRTIRVILRRLNEGTIHFFSIMQENTKPPEGGL